MSTLVRWLLRIGRLVASDEALGDLAEEHASGRRGAWWLCRNILSTIGTRRSHAATGNRRPEMISNLLQDIRYSLRTLRRNPGFAVAAIAPIALGIGINTGIFSLLDAVALQPVQSRNPAELVTVYQKFQGVKQRRIHGSRSMFSLPEYQAYRDRTQMLSGMMAFSQYWTLTLGGESPREVDGALVTCNYFDVLQLHLAVGIGFTAANCEAPDAPPSVVVSHDLWSRAFAADRDIVNKTITLNGRQVAVAGVAPEGFGGIDFARVSLFAPIPLQAFLRPEDDYYRDAYTSWLTIVGRRKGGLSIAQTRAELEVIAGQIDREQPGRTTTLSVAPARSLSLPEMRKDILSVATIVLVAFGLVLLLACANVANLLLARATGRSREMAVRLSVGANRRRLLQQLLTESMIIAFAGAAAGSLLAWWSVRGLLALLGSALPGTVPALSIDPHLNLTVLSFALAMTIATGLVFGAAPALQASRLDLHTLLNRDSLGAGRRTGWLRGSLIGIQVAVCMVLLISAGLLMRGLYTAETVDPGFDYRQVAVVSFDLRGGGYNDQRAVSLRQQFIERFRALPGVDGVATVAKTPLSPGRSQTMARVPGEQAWHEIDVNTVSPDYFSLIGIPIVRGRTFSDADLSANAPVAIVSEATARRYWPGVDPIGRTLVMALGSKNEKPLEVVGVTRDAQVSRLAEIDSSYVYLPAGSASLGLHVLVRSQADFRSLAPAVRSAARDVAPGLVVNVNRLEDNLSFWRTIARLVVGLSGSLSLLTLILASIGVYGVVSYVVSRRRREVVIRMALGANARDVQRLILRQTLRPVVIGIAIGVALATAVAQVLTSVLFGISPFDPVAFVGAPLFLVTVAVAASLLPTRQALTADAMATLRAE